MAIAGAIRAARIARTQQAAIPIVAIVTATPMKGFAGPRDLRYVPADWCRTSEFGRP